MKKIVLNDGNAIPELGLGTYRLKPNEAYNSVKAALAIGYRHIDTANVYFNEEAIGRAIKESGIPREELFITSKIFPNAFKEIDKAIDNTLDRLGIDYLDLLLLHRPYGDYVSAYTRLVEAKKNGKTKSIGVSNFTMKHIAALESKTEVIPAINQIEITPYFTRDEERRLMKEKGIVIEAWSPFGSGSKTLLHDPLLEKVAKAHNKSVPQVIIRFLLDKEIVVFPGSKSEPHIKSNFEIDDFTLTEDETKAIESLNTKKPAKDLFGKFLYRLLPKDFSDRE